MLKIQQKKKFSRAFFLIIILTAKFVFIKLALLTQFCFLLIFSMSCNLHPFHRYAICF